MDLFDLAAKITLDSSEYERGLDEAKGKTTSFASSLGNGLKTAAKIGTAAVGAAAAGITAITSKSVSAYSQYEQLVGGIETLFGDSAQRVLADSANAFQSAGMSMNEYMETSIQSAASLINSLGGDQEAAAALMNMSITDMADNVNKMGTSMEAVQNAYRGFSRGNFTMLDNLALGFAGTKDGMQELLDKAQELSGVEYDIESYADIVEAIHVVQTEMGITGTTAKEASETIAGSTASMKSAWQNLVTGLADENANIDVLVSNLVSSVESVMGNIIPVAQRALSGIGKMITQLAPIVVSGISNLASKVLPSVIASAVSLISSLGQAIISNAPILMQTALDIVLMLADGIMENVDLLIEGAVTLISQLATWIGEYSSVITSAAVDLIIALVMGLTNPSNISQLVDSAIFLMLSLAEALIDAAPRLIQAIPAIVMNLVQAFVDNAPALIEAGGELIAMLIDGIMESGAELLSSVWEVMQGVIAVFPEAWDAVKTATVNAWNKIKTSVDNATTKIRNSLSTAWNNIKAKSAETWENVKAVATEKTEAMKSMLQGKWDAIKGAYEKHGGGLKGAAAAAIEGIKQYFSLGFDSINALTGGKLDGIKQKFTDIFEKLKSIVTNALDKVKAAFNFQWKLPDLKLPHITVSGGVAPFGIGGAGSLPRFNIQWYKKAYEDPVLFSKPTVVPTLAGMKGFGDGNGSEVVLGMNKLKELVGAAGDITVNVYGSPGMDVNRLADAVQARLVAVQKQRMLAYG